MLDGLKNLGNLGSLMAKAQEMQSKFKNLQEELAKKTITTEAAGGMVQATVNGRLELIKLRSAVPGLREPAGYACVGEE